MTTPIGVLLAEDDELIRVALVSLLEREPDIAVVGTVPDGRQAVEQALRHRPAVAVVDLEMPKLDGISVIKELRSTLPECAGVILTGHAARICCAKRCCLAPKDSSPRARPARLWRT